MGAGRAAAEVSSSINGAGLSDRPMRDLRNHEEDFVDRVGDSATSREGVRKLLSDILRPNNLEVDDLGLRGSTASVKYS